MQRVRAGQPLLGGGLWCVLLLAAACGAPEEFEQLQQAQSTTCDAIEVLRTSDAQAFVFRQDDALGMRLAAITRGRSKFLNNGSFWQLELRENGESSVDRRGAADAGSFSCTKSVAAAETRLHLRWKSVSGSAGGVFAVNVDVFVNNVDPQLFVSSAIDFDENTSNKQGVWKLRVPMLDLDDQGPHSELLLGVFGGVRIVNPAKNARKADGNRFEFSYPGTQYLPLTGYAKTTPFGSGTPDADSGKLLFVASVDADASRYALKDLAAGATDRGSVSIDIGRRPSNPFSGHDVKSVGTSAIGIVDCKHATTCWDALGSWYRNWVEGHRVFDRPPLAQIQGPARQVIDYDVLALIGHGDGPLPPNFSQHRADLDEIVTNVGVNPNQVASIWYDWHNNHFFNEIPDHLPPLPGFVQTMQAAIAAGHRVTPYTNTGSWSPNVPSYAEFDIANQAAVINPDGSVDARNDFGAPYLAQLVEDYLYAPIIDLGVSGVLLDTLPAGKPCFATNHGHPVGGGASYSAGIRDLINRLHTVNNPTQQPRMVFTEGSSESTVDLASGAHSYRTLNLFNAANPNALGHVPLFDTVYRHRIPMITLTSVNIPGNPLYVGIRTLHQSGDPSFFNIAANDFYLRAGWAFAAGHIVAHFRRPIADTTHGITSNWQDPLFGEFLEFWGTITRLRAEPAVKQFLLHGQMASQPLALSLPVKNPQTIDPIRPYASAETPSVLSYAFTNEGNLAVTIFNWTADAQPFYLKLDPRAYGITDVTGRIAGKWRVAVALSGGVSEVVPDIAALEDTKSVLELFMFVPPRAPIVLIYEKVGP